MKISLVAAAMLMPFVGLATAQSAVTVFGTLDVNGRYVKNEGSPRRLSLSQDGINQSQLGFQGTEDLGDGLKAAFSLISTLNPDTGAVNAKFWNRRSTVSLMNHMGELRLGRDYVPTFWNNVVFDAFGACGVGNAFNVWQLQTTYPGSPVFGNFVRADNSIGYFLPSNLYGIYGQAMVAASEGATNQGRVIGARIGYISGPFDIALAALQQRFDLASNPAVTGITAGNSQKTYNAGASYDLKVVKLFGMLDRDTRTSLTETRGSVGAVIPFGLSLVRLGYSRSKLTNDLAHSTNIDSSVQAAYQYNLSKRTAVYTSVARLTNGRNPLTGVTQSVAGWNAGFAGTSQTAPPTPGGKSTGFEVGLRHFF